MWAAAMVCPVVATLLADPRVEVNAETTVRRGAQAGGLSDVREKDPGMTSAHPLDYPVWS